MYNSKCFLLLAFVSICIIGSAQKSQQKFKFGDVRSEDFEPKAYPVDSSANAVYLYDVGSSSYEGNTSGLFDVVYNKHARIRLINKNGFDMATVEIHLYTNGKFQEKLEDLNASTYNIEDGKVVVTKVDKSSLFKDKGTNEIIEKFTFPNIKEGSIVEYNYKVSSPSYRFIEPWYFQGDYPRLWSQYSVNIPSFYDFVTLTQGYQPYIIDSAELSKDNYNILDPGESASDRSQNYRFTSNTVFHKRAMQKVPALKE